MMIALYPIAAFDLWCSSVSPGVSDEAQRVCAEIHAARASFDDSLSYGLPRREFFQALDRAFAECSVADWDGYGAAPADSAAYEMAKRFVAAYPPGLPTPEVAVDPDGEVAFEWFASPRQVFSVSIGPWGRLSYAGLFGSDKVKDAEVFTGEMPKAILENIERVGLL